ncbi:hypothetical protein [Providencia sp. JUb39]|uniref:hypothetical protein n=1 Tax=Providencia sp. JUb39 TaxID=2724165 RepID=UPI00164D920C|nr:hypothetical protein [Providencia sp. JUb39]MBC5791448.1 hypothetical protein [Providencia sp. JUb39]
MITFILKTNVFLKVSLYLILLSYTMYSHANYAPKIISPADGYKIKLSSNSKLDYVKDDDPQKQLPLINKITKEKIYSTLMMTDYSIEPSGLDMNVDIEKLKTISISSHLQGTNASAGDYRGSAWLIKIFI